MPTGTTARKRNTADKPAASKTTTKAKATATKAKAKDPKVEITLEASQLVAFTVENRRDPKKDGGVRFEEGAQLTEHKLSEQIMRQVYVSQETDALLGGKESYTVVILAD